MVLRGTVLKGSFLRAFFILYAYSLLQPSSCKMIVDAILFALGAILHFAPWALNWFGKLPGDIRIENERSSIFIPIISMIIISIVASILINLFKR